MCFKEAFLDIFVSISYIVTLILVYILSFFTSRDDINLYYFHKIVFFLYLGQISLTGIRALPCHIYMFLFYINKIFKKKPFQNMNSPMRNNMSYPHSIRHKACLW